MFIRFLTTAIIIILVFTARENSGAQDLPRNVHIVVALADNENQGIVPIPAKLGDGNNPATNLYWGALYGIQTHFSKKLERKTSTKIGNPDGVLETITFHMPSHNLNITAEAWRGDKMRQAIRRFDRLLTQKNGPDLVVFVGHNGLMDTFVPGPISIAGTKNLSGKAAMVLACKSEAFFSDRIRASGATPLLMTRGLMAPEAYSLLPAIDAWAAGRSANDVRNAAARGYAKYQKIPLRNAQRLFGAAP